MKTVSIVIPVHNCESTIRRSLMSIQNQTYKDYEVIVVNNNCTDGTISIVKEFKDKFDLKIVDCEIPGIVPSLNTGIRHVQGKYIARQDGDDYWYDTKLEKQINFLDSNPDVGVLGTQITILDTNGNIQEKGTMGIEIVYPTMDDDCRRMMIYGENPICHPSVVIREELLRLTGGYEKVFPKAEDLHLWLKLFPHTKFANLEETLVDYTQTFSPDYDARVPLVMSDMYFGLYKMAGLIQGEKEKRIWDWERSPDHHGNVTGQ